MKLRNFIISLILAVIIGAIIYELTNDSLVKSVRRIQEHNLKLEEMNKLIAR